MKIRNMMALCVMCILLVGCRMPKNEQIATIDTSVGENMLETERKDTTATTTEGSELEVPVETEAKPEEETTETLGRETEPEEETTDMTETGTTPPEEENPGQSTSGGSNELPGERE